MTPSENKATFETHREIDEYFHSSINAEMLTIADRTHTDYAECTSMVFHSFSKVVDNALESMKLNGAKGVDSPRVRRNAANRRLVECKLDASKNRM